MKVSAPTTLQIEGNQLGLAVVMIRWGRLEQRAIRIDGRCTINRACKKLDKFNNGVHHVTVSGERTVCLVPEKEATDARGLSAQLCRFVIAAMMLPAL